MKGGDAERDRIIRGGVSGSAELAHDVDGVCTVRDRGGYVGYCVAVCGHNWLGWWRTG